MNGHRSYPGPAVTVVDVEDSTIYPNVHSNVEVLPSPGIADCILRQPMPCHESTWKRVSNHRLNL